jgi:hypothetical protein
MTAWDSDRDAVEFAGAITQAVPATSVERGAGAC